MTAIRKLLAVCAASAALVVGATAPTLMTTQAADHGQVDAPADTWPKSPGSA
jgi:hypothetical protein